MKTMDYLNINNKIVWNTKGDSMIEIYGDKVLQIILYLEENRNTRGISIFTLEDMIISIGYKPNNHKGKINDQVKKILANLQNDGLLVSDYDLGSIKPTELIKARLLVNEIEEGYFPIEYKVIDTIYNGETKCDKATLLKVICYISARVRRLEGEAHTEANEHGNWVGEKVEYTFFKQEEATKDLKIDDHTWQDAIKELKKLGLLFYDNIGQVKKGNLIITAGNCYCLDAKFLNGMDKCSRAWYKENGYTIVAEEQKKDKKARIEAKSRRSYLRKKIKNGKITESEIIEFAELGGNYEEELAKLNVEEEEPTRVVTTKRGIGGKPNRRRIEDLF